jgi:hypothetical protein
MKFNVGLDSTSYNTFDEFIFSIKYVPDPEMISG